MPTSGEKVTIYFKGPAGISKKEGVLQYADKHGVSFIPKRARKPATIMSYYDPFWMVVKGHGHPDPGSNFNEPEAGATPGVTVQKGKYRSTDPRWVDDLMAGAAKGLKPLCMYKDGTFTNPGNVPAPPERQESIRSELEDLRSLL
jgi:hypothetical protein